MVDVRIGNLSCSGRAPLSDVVPMGIPGRGERPLLDEYSDRLNFRCWPTA